MYTLDLRVGDERYHLEEEELFRLLEKRTSLLKSIAPSPQPLPPESPSDGVACVAPASEMAVENDWYRKRIKELLHMVGSLEEDKETQKQLKFSIHDELSKERARGLELAKTLRRAYEDSYKVDRLIFDLRSILSKTTDSCVQHNMVMKIATRLNLYEDGSEK